MLALAELGAAEAAAAIRAGDISAQSLVDALLDRCTRAASLNAFICLDPDAVRAAARSADQQRQRGERLGPLHGVPIALKDNFDTADFTTTAGTPALAAHRPTRNAAVVQRLLDAGALILGKANMQELAFGPTSNNAAFGPVRNPYDRSRIPGGSSGGTAALVAARLAPAGLGTDTGGSVRVPASLSGVVGFRPTTLRWPQDGIVPISHTRDTAAPIARCVADCALLDGIVTGGPTSLAPINLEGPASRRSARPLLGRPRCRGGSDPRRRIGAARRCRRRTGLGRHGRRGCPRRRGGVSVALYEFVTDLDRYLAGHATGLDFAGVAAQVKSPAVKKVVDALLGPDAVPEAVYREALIKHRPALQDAYRRYFAERGVAAMVFPTTPLPAAKVGEDDTVLLNGKAVPTLATYIRNLGPGSAAGIPGLSLPAGMTSAAASDWNRDRRAARRRSAIANDLPRD